MRSIAVDLVSPSVLKRKSVVLGPDKTMDRMQKVPKPSRPSELHGVIGDNNSPQLLNLQTPMYPKQSIQGANRGPMTYPRKRAVAACLRCRARKTKCDNQRPSCGFCTGIGAECQYEGVTEHSSFDPASLHMIDYLNQIMKKQDEILAHIQSNSNNNAPCTPGVGSGEPCFDEVNPSTIVETTADSKRTTVPLWESPANYLKIPSSRTTPDNILTWSIFNGVYQPGTLQAAVFEQNNDSQYFQSHLSSPTTDFLFSGFDDAEVSRLTNRFLSLVHTKNPILDEYALRKMAHTVAEEGLRWDGTSCLVLLACVLGCVANPFAVARSQATINPQHFRQLQSNVDRSSREKAESLYMLARRRIGIPTHAIIASQCHFLSGVYLMYVLRPVEAYQEFHQAAIKFQIHLKLSCSLPKTDRDRKLEQRMYWSCFKSECEILSEVTLPESGIADIEYPHMFPSPPEIGSDSGSLVLSPAAITPPSFASPSSNMHSSSIAIQHEQEKSWFYYLSEIALRRIGNRILNAFYREENLQWANMNVNETIKIAEEFVRQLEQWYEGLPPPLKYSQDLSDIPTEELSYMIRARVLELRSWIYRPFLYYVIHNEPDDLQQIAKSIAEQALTYSARLIECNSIRHRHHGIWYTCRVSASAALSILSAVRSPHVGMPTGWEDTVQLAIETLLLWEVDAPGDLRKARIILTELYCQNTGEGGPE